MRIVLSIGGSVLAAPQDGERVAGYADAIRELVHAGCQVGVVVGGGAVARDYIESGRDLGANEIELDEIGIAVSRLNARVLMAALGDMVPSGPAETYRAARTDMARGGVAVMGGTDPGHTTDAVSAALAEFVNADLLVLATSVPGVFDADPAATSDATRFDRLTPTELVSTVAKLEMNAGSSAPVDLLGAKLIERAGTHAIVIEGTDPSAVVAAVQDGEFDGTEIIPGDADPPTIWHHG